MEKTLVYFEDEYKDVELVQPKEKHRKKVKSLDDIVGMMDEIGF